jgi:micrococcal nuclease
MGGYSNKKACLYLGLLGFGFSIGLFLAGKDEVKNDDDLRLEGRAVQVVDVYDGDTIKVNIAGLPPLFGEKVSIRLRGIDTPEMRGGTIESKAKAKVSRDHLAGILSGNVVTLHNVGRGKFFRVVADVRAGGMDVVPEMLRAGMGEPYDGGAR